ncbi:MAG: nucleoside deaminase [Devosia sp.]|jgi:tRNA(Arg) A34 adenosine deaminase TadA|uniref:nucleoside deaminase n=1 Tax=Devosia sp. TaxID=1871048 RepID=UPI001A5D47F1|nr:nucleoside deaminase [Devosia sp.]MBL8599823.1 nucleoside deaminase [Devosia sp.]
MDDIDRRHLIRCVELAEAALTSGNDPFGSVLVAANGTVLREDYNRAGGGDETRHPEFELARWAAGNMTPEARAGATVYTSGEHCPMCSAAHAWVGLGRIVYAVSAAQLVEWRTALGAPPSPVAVLPIEAIAPGVRVDGPEPTLRERMKQLHLRHHEARRTGGR